MSTLLDRFALHPALVQIASHSEGSMVPSLFASTAAKAS
jgi:hypothetical protein